ncbi:MAG: lipoyl synthase [Holosporales bacterium]|jgi:lipoic acid synthetase|nr:lipoyl synthase [Holosporales bacterium]
MVVSETFWVIFSMAHPDWLRIRIQDKPGFTDTLRVVKESAVRTVCEDASCPNLNECWAKKTATFLIMGEFCTRNCGFCDIKNGRPQPLDPDEPGRIAQAVLALGLKYVVLTSVTRDDLMDGGAQHFSEVIMAIRNINCELEVEVLTPDFQACMDSAIETILAVRPTVFAHNLEIVKKYHHIVKRKPSSYETSMTFLKKLRNRVTTKTGIMVGVGESKRDVFDFMDEISDIGIDILTIGQYLAPSRGHHPVARYVSPEEFDEYRDYGERRGIKLVCSGPLVRSSYRARESFQLVCNLK